MNLNVDTLGTDGVEVIAQNLEAYSDQYHTVLLSIWIALANAFLLNIKILFLTWNHGVWINEAGNLSNILLYIQTFEFIFGIYCFINLFFMLIAQEAQWSLFDLKVHGVCHRRQHRCVQRCICTIHIKTSSMHILLLMLTHTNIAKLIIFHAWM